MIQIQDYGTMCMFWSLSIAASQTNEWSEQVWAGCKGGKGCFEFRPTFHNLANWTVGYCPQWYMCAQLFWLRKSLPAVTAQSTITLWCWSRFKGNLFQKATIALLYPSAALFANLPRVESSTRSTLHCLNKPHQKIIPLEDWCHLALLFLISDAVSFGSSSFITLSVMLNLVVSRIEIPILSSNLQVLGAGEAATVGSTVSVNYTGRLLNGPEPERARESLREP